MFTTALTALNAVFQKRERMAEQRSGVNTQRSKKVKTGLTTEAEGSEVVPAFLTHSERIDVSEDPSSFEVGWGLRKKDTVVGDTHRAAEWSRSIVTPRDRVNVVESSDDLQVENLGAHGIATVLLSLSLLVAIISLFQLFLTTLFCVIF